MDTIIEGCAEILWALAWADHVDSADCCSLSGCDICEVMPPVGEQATREAYRICGRVEQAAGVSLWPLLCSALRADSPGMTVEESIEVMDESANRFGNCIAYMALGHGVSWFDDRAKCAAFSDAMDRVHTECDLEQEAAAACDCAETERGTFDELMAKSPR